MAQIDDAINSLTPDELDLLNSDPEMLAAFKAKYAQPQSMGAGIASDAMRELGKSPLEHVKDLDPAKILPMVGAAGTAAPGAFTAAFNSLPGIGNPAAIMTGLQDLKQNPGQVGDAVIRANAIGQGEAPKDGDEKTAVNAGKAAGMLMDLAMPGDEGGVIGDKLKGWSQQAARNAIGFVKSLANKGDVEDLPAVADFVMSPVKIGDTTLPAILTSNATPREMLANADNVLKVAGPKLGEVSQTMDAAINAKPELIDLDAIENSLEALKGTVEKNAKELGAPVVSQYEKAINDFRSAVNRSPDVGQRIMGQTPSNPQVFTALQKLKQTVGELMGEGDNVVPSKTAMQKIYGVFADALSDAAKGVSDELGQAYDEANNAYTYASDAVAGLRGRIRGEETKQLLPSLKSLITHPVPIDPAALASGLGWASKNVPQAVSAASRAIPGVLSGLTSGLSLGQQ